MEQSLIAQGLELMLYGMGSVLLFLALLVLVTSLMSSLLGARGDVAMPPVTAHPVDQGVDPRTLAIISAAIHAHRQRHLQSTPSAAGSEGGPSQRRSSSS
ncbi:MAG: OadG family transporter subunit [Halieaceae bacterium]|nr:OadG family transporter subunit [Halieaceae bacterium]